MTDHSKPAAANLRQAVKPMPEVKVVKHVPRKRTATAPPGAESPRNARPAANQVRVIGIGTSTGGPRVLQAILAGLPKDFPAPILVVQHIAPGFLQGLVDWLAETSGFHVQIATHGVDPLPGHVYLAPDSCHMGLSARAVIHLSTAEPEGGVRPAISYLFRTLAGVCGLEAVGVLLTGMGRDGAAELKLMRDRGAITIAQDRESSVVHGMPGAAIALGGATHVVSASKIAAALAAIVTRRHAKAGDW